MTDAPRDGSRADGPLLGTADEQPGPGEQWAIDHLEELLAMFGDVSKRVLLITYLRKQDAARAELVAALTDAAAHMESLAGDDRHLFPADRNALMLRAREARDALAKVGAR